MTSTSLPQHDPSAERRVELAKIRSTYEWDHESFAPFPMLRVQSLDKTGILHLLAVVEGSYVGLPEAERPSNAFMYQKLRSSLPATRAILSHVPMLDWGIAGLSFDRALETRLDRWELDIAGHLLRAIDTKGELHVELPAPEALLVSVVEHVLGYVGEIAAEVQDDVVRANRALSGVGQALERLCVGIGLDETRLREVRRLARGLRTQEDAVRAEALGRVAHKLGVPQKITLGVIALQAALRFAANTEARPPKVHRRSQLVGDELPEPGLPDPCDDDLAFGRYHTHGPDPISIRRVRSRAELPERFPVTPALFRSGIEGLGLPSAQRPSLDDAIRAGRVYQTDYAVLDGLPCQVGPAQNFFGEVRGSERGVTRYLPAPHGLFYASERGLLPVVIQLGRDPEAFERFTPADEPAVWARVKMAYLCAYLNNHEMGTHLAEVHLLLPSFVVAAARQLHPDHPISVLLRPHVENLLWNDFLGAQVLINPTGFIEQIMSGELEGGSKEICRRFYEAFDYADLHFPSELVARGVDDPACLPDYPLRDDGLQLWHALRGFVAEYLAVYYVEPERDLAEDHELQAWFDELRSRQGGRVAGLPDTFDLDDLVDLVTGIVFRSSCFHSAVNYPQYEYFCEISRTPAALYADPREVRTRSKEAFLPAGDPALTQITVVSVLAGMRHKVLTDYQLGWFGDPRVWPLVARLRTELVAIEARIDERNRHRQPYDYLRPSMVAASANV